MPISLLNQKTLCLLTGASRGIGKTIAERLAPQLGANSVMILVARSAGDLGETVNCVRAANANILVFGLVNDLGVCNFGNIAASISEAIADLTEAEPFELATVIHNAGSVGNLSKPAHELHDYNELKRYFDFNLHSFILLNSLFLQLTDGKVKKQLIINITSLAAIQGIPSMAVYSTAKAARESFLRVLLAERPELRILNYSPGPVATEMQKEVAASSFHKDIQKWSEELAAKGGLLTCEQTTTKLVQILADNSFENGVHLDYYDYDAATKTPSVDSTVNPS